MNRFHRLFLESHAAEVVANQYRYHIHYKETF